MKIIFLGDSLTEGIYGGNFVDIIRQRFPEHEIINAGMSGSTIINLERRLDEVIEQSPDGVFVMTGGNDSISYSQVGTRPYYKKAREIPEGFVSPEQFAQTYRDVLQRLQLAFIQVWVGLPPKEYNPEVIASQKQFNAIVKEVADSLSIPTLDFMAEFEPPAEAVQDRPPIDIGLIATIGKRSSEGWDDYENERQRLGFTYSFDGIHITPKTAERFAERIIDFMEL
jgi:lysophospholipase L1-like esterase